MHTHTHTYIYTYYIHIFIKYHYPLCYIQIPDYKIKPVDKERMSDKERECVDECISEIGNY